MSWLEYNIHIRRSDTWYPDIVATLTDFVAPFIREQKDEGRFTRWHYLIEPDKCRNGFREIRIRFQGEQENLNAIERELIGQLRDFTETRNLTVRNDHQNGSHVGCHGRRGERYAGESETYGEDWPHIVDIMHEGSNSALRILCIGKKLRTDRSLRCEQRSPLPHQYYLHLPANQLLIEP